MLPLPQRCTLPAHEEATLPLQWSPLPWPSPLQLPSPSLLPLPTPLPFLLPLAIAISIAVNHCHRHLCHVTVSHRCCCCPCYRTLPSLSPLVITVAISDHRCHCRRPFPRVVALARRELYLNNLSKECLPNFILFGQWAVHSSKPDE